MSVVTDGKIILEWISKKHSCKVWTGCILLRTRTSDWLLGTH